MKWNCKVTWWNNGQGQDTANFEVTAETAAAAAKDLIDEMARRDWLNKGTEELTVEVNRAE